MSGSHLLTLNLVTAKWSVLPGPTVPNPRYCPLPNGRILFGIGSEGAQATTYRLYLTSPDNSPLIPLSSDQLGVIHGISCAGDGQNVYLSVGEYPASVYAATDTGIDGSALTK